MASTILIIDDDKFTRQVLSKILQRDESISAFKPTIVEASNGMEGLRLFDVHKPVLVIVDLLMPKMDGFAVCKRLREKAKEADLTLAVTSGVYKDAAISRRLRDEFQAHFFAKPYQIKKIAEFVAQTLSPESENAGRNASDGDEDKSALSGSLKKRSAAKLFLDFLEEEKSGRLLLRRGQVVRQIELFVGHPVSITTNVREETLGHFLVAKKRISRETHRLAMNLASKNRVRFGEAVIEMGVLSANELLQELTAQTRYKLVNALRWRSGTWSFRPGAPRNSNSNTLNVVEVIVNGLAATAQLEPTPPLLSALRTKPLTLNTRGQKLLAQLSASVSPNFAKRFSAGITIEGLEAAEVNHVEIFTCLDVLVQCDGLETTVPESDHLRPADETTDSFKLKSIAHARKRRNEGPDLIDSLFDSQEASNTMTGRSPLTELGSVELWKSLKTNAGEVQEDFTKSNDGDETQAADHEVIPPEERRRRRRSSLVKAQAQADDSVVDVDFSAPAEAKELSEGRSAIIGEFLRIQQKTLYDVLKVSSAATEDEIKSAHDQIVEEFEKGRFSKIELGRDFHKLNVLHATYNRCVETLLDKSKRSRYDKSLDLSDEQSNEIPSLDAEIAFHEGERLLATGDHTGALEKLKEAVAIAPTEAAYKAELGWTIFVQGKKEARAADEARTYINEALTMAPDDVLANEYKGLIDAHLGDDLETALVHLEKAIRGNPRRVEALRKIEEIRISQGQYHELQKLYRRILFGIKGTSDEEEALIWGRLGDLYRHCLSDDESALIAFEAALRITPLDEELQGKIEELKGGDRAQYYGLNRQILTRWQEAPTDPAPLLELFELALKTEHNDGAFLAASGLVAAGYANTDAEANYQRHRPRYLLRAQRALDSDIWSYALFPDDYALLGALYALLSEIIKEVAPATDAAAEVARGQDVPDSDLLANFLAVRGYIAHSLGVAEPAIVTHEDYGRVVHLATVSSPVLMVGKETLACADKLELAFRLGRAMSFMRPGRAVAASFPSSVLKSAMLACYSLRSPNATVPDPDGTVGEFKTRISQADEVLQRQVRELVSHISQEHPSLNLSRWVRTLNRTADRVGMLLCGDLPTALRSLSDPSDTEAANDLIAFAVSPSHIQLRHMMGLSVEV